MERLYRLLLPQAVIVQNSSGEPKIYDLDNFIAPRKTLLAGGKLTEFQEWETSERTELLGNIAHRRSIYEKTWNANGKACEGRGVKSLQFVRTPDGWRIASLLWVDET